MNRAIIENMADTSNDIYNTYKECAECGECCTLTVIAMTHDEAKRIQDYMRENGVVAKDQGPEVCPLRGEDMRCMVYPARARTCRLHHCRIPRSVLEKEHPEFAAPDDLPMVDMRQAFIHNDLRDPRTIPLDRLIAHYSM